MKKPHDSWSDPELKRLVLAEENRQAETLDLIPSENFAPVGVRDLMGSVLMNKYSEGYARRRYYPGNEYVDAIEELAEQRAKRAFRLGDQWTANVQPYSGSPANIAIYLGLIELGDTIMGMQLSAGGHLTHGHKVNFSGRGFRSVPYGLHPTTGLIDYDALEKLAMKEKPKVIIAGLTAYPRIIDFRRFGKIAKKVHALLVADISHIAGLVAAGLHPSPFPYADAVMTTTHKILRGPRGAVIFARKQYHDQIAKAVFPGIQGGPHDNTTAAIAYAFREAATPAYKKYAATVLANADRLAKELIRRDLALVTGGTSNHLMLVDVRPAGLDGKEGEALLERAGIIANRNTIPGDTTPFKPSGIRMGTPSMTTRGLGPKDMPKVADWIARVLFRRAKPETIAREIKLFLSKYPVS